MSVIGVTLILCLLTQTVAPVSAGGVLSIKLLNFENRRGLTVDGQCCDPTPQDGALCRNQCDYVLRLVISGLGRANDHVFLFHRPLQYDSNDLQFQKGGNNVTLTVFFDGWPTEGDVKMNTFFYDYDDTDHTTSLVDWFETELSAGGQVDRHTGQQQVIARGNRRHDKTRLVFEWSRQCGDNSSPGNDDHSCQSNRSQPQDQSWKKDIYQDGNDEDGNDDANDHNVNPRSDGGHDPNHTSDDGIQQSGVQEDSLLRGSHKVRSPFKPRRREHYRKNRVISYVPSLKAKNLSKISGTKNMDDTKKLNSLPKTKNMNSNDLSLARSNQHKNPYYFKKQKIQTWKEIEVQRPPENFTINNHRKENVPEHINVKGRRMGNSSSQHLNKVWHWKEHKNVININSRSGSLTAAAAAAGPAGIDRYVDMTHSNRNRVQQITTSTAVPKSGNMTRIKHEKQRLPGKKTREFVGPSSRHITRYGKQKGTASYASFSVTAKRIDITEERQVSRIFPKVSMHTNVSVSIDKNTFSVFKSTVRPAERYDYNDPSTKVDSDKIRQSAADNLLQDRSKDASTVPVGIQSARPTSPSAFFSAKSNRHNQITKQASKTNSSSDTAQKNGQDLPSLKAITKVQYVSKKTLTHFTQTKPGSSQSANSKPRVARTDQAVTSHSKLSSVVSQIGRDIENSFAKKDTSVNVTATRIRNSIKAPVHLKRPSKTPVKPNISVSNHPFQNARVKVPRVKAPSVSADLDSSSTMVTSAPRTLTTPKSKPVENRFLQTQASPSRKTVSKTAVIFHSLITAPPHSVITLKQTSDLHGIRPNMRSADQSTRNTRAPEFQLTKSNSASISFNRSTDSANGNKHAGNAADNSASLHTQSESSSHRAPPLHIHSSPPASTIDPKGLWRRSKNWMAGANNSTLSVYGSSVPKASGTALLFWTGSAALSQQKGTVTRQTVLGTESTVAEKRRRTLSRALGATEATIKSNQATSPSSITNGSMTHMLGTFPRNVSSPSNALETIFTTPMAFTYAQSRQHFPVTKMPPPAEQFLLVDESKSRNQSWDKSQNVTSVLSWYKSSLPTEHVLTKPETNRGKTTKERSMKEMKTTITTDTNHRQGIPLPTKIMKENMLPDLLSNISVFVSKLTVSWNANQQFTNISVDANASPGVGKRIPNTISRQPMTMTPTSSAGNEPGTGFTKSSPMSKLISSTNIPDKGYSTISVQSIAKRSPALFEGTSHETTRARGGIRFTHSLNSLNSKSTATAFSATTPKMSVNIISMRKENDMMAPDSEIPVPQKKLKLNTSGLFTILDKLKLAYNNEQKVRQTPMSTKSEKRNDLSTATQSSSATVFKTELKRRPTTKRTTQSANPKTPFSSTRAGKAGGSIIRDSLDIWSFEKIGADTRTKKGATKKSIATTTTLASLFREEMLYTPPKQRKGNSLYKVTEPSTITQTKKRNRKISEIPNKKQSNNQIMNTYKKIRVLKTHLISTDLKNASKHGPKVMVPKNGLYVPRLFYSEDKTFYVNDTKVHSFINRTWYGAPVVSSSDIRRSGTPTHRMSVKTVFHRYWPAILGVTVGTVFLVLALLTSLACRQQRLLARRRRRWQQDTPQHVTTPPPATSVLSSSSGSFSS